MANNELEILSKKSSVEELQNSNREWKWKKMRIDKFLKMSTVIKRRTVANEAADGGRISVNGKIVKPSYEVKIGVIGEFLKSQILKYYIQNESPQYQIS